MNKRDIIMIIVENIIKNDIEYNIIGNSDTIYIEKRYDNDKKQPSLFDF